MNEHWGVIKKKENLEARNKRYFHIAQTCMVNIHMFMFCELLSIFYYFFYFILFSIIRYKSISRLLMRKFWMLKNDFTFWLWLMNFNFGFWILNFRFGKKKLNYSLEIRCPTILLKFGIRVILLHIYITIKDFFATFFWYLKVKKDETYFF